MVERLQYTCFNWRSDLIFFQNFSSLLSRNLQNSPLGVTTHHLTCVRAPKSLSQHSLASFLWDFMIPGSWYPSWYGNLFRTIGPLRGESTGHQWVFLTKTNKAKVWCSLWCWLVQAVKQAITWLGMHKQDNIYSSSMYGYDLPLSGARCHTSLQKRSRKGWYSGNFSQVNGPGVINSTSMKSKLTVWSTNLV